MVGDFEGYLHWFDLETGDFTADIVNLEAFMSSPFIDEFIGAELLQAQLLSPAAAGELFLITDGFTADGQTIMPDFTNFSSLPVPAPPMLALFAAALAVLIVVRRRGSVH